ncbi:MAG: hypothetical protein ABFC96_04640 [Thermoguttaceae bacterium]
MKSVNPAMLTVLLIFTILGCTNDDERLVEMAREHAARQAESQRQMVDLEKQVAEGSRRLVESDAKAREHLTVLQHDLRADQAEVGRQRDRLENDRRELAAQRHWDPIVAAVITDVGILLACLLPLALGVYVLWSARRGSESDSVVTELLVEELVASKPRLLLPGQSSFSPLDYEPDETPPDAGPSDDRPAG